MDILRSFLSKPRHMILMIVAGGALTLSTMTMAFDGMAPHNQVAQENSLSLAVSGTSAGVRTEYFKQAVTAAIVASGIFSNVETNTSDVSSGTDEVMMPMIGTSIIFSGVGNGSGTPYFLKIRILKVHAPSFSVRMTVSMNTIWSLYRTAGNTELLHQKISSTYTGGMFEGGLIGADRVRVAMEGAVRENIRIGMGVLKSVNLMDDLAPGAESGQ